MGNISIVVVSLNTKVEFMKTINSILSQKNKNYEIIVIDGFSQDGTVEEIYKLKNLLFDFKIEKDDGIYYAMNKSIRLIKSEWTIFLNSGDIFFDNNIIDKIHDFKKNSVDIIYGDTIINNEFFKYKINGKNFNTKTCIMPFCHQSSIVKTNILKSYMFDTNYKLSSDFDFFYKCFLNGKKFVYFNNVISIIKSGGISDKNRSKVYNENIKILKNKKNFFLIMGIYKLKFYQTLVSIIKILLPNNLIKKILKFKYKKNTVK